MVLWFYGFMVLHKTINNDDEIIFDTPLSIFSIISKKDVFLPNKSMKNDKKT